MYRRRLAAAALAALTAGTAPAVAHPPNDADYVGACSFHAVHQADVPAGGPDTWHGEISAYAVAYAPTFAHNPVTVTAMRCVLSVNGEPRVTVDARTAGPFAVLEPTPVQYEAKDGDIVDLCEYVETVDAHGQAATGRCGALGPAQVPPQVVVDVLSAVLDATGDVAEVVDGVWVGVLDPVVCPVLVADTLVYDCPPYSE